MDETLDGPPVATIPDRLDRRLRLGPFASARDTLRFVTYAAAGAVVVPFTGAGAWLVVLAVGFGAVVLRVDGQSADEHLFAVVLWALRGLAGGPPLTEHASGRSLRRGLLEIAGRRIAIVRAEGTPVAYLPPAELARRFARFRELLRSVDGAVALLVATVPMSSAPVRPRGHPSTRGDAEALAGYAQLVDALCRRRQVRRVYIALGTTRAGAEGLAELEGKVAGMGERLSALELTAVRLRGGPLLDAGRRWGWS